MLDNPPVLSGNIKGMMARILCCTAMMLLGHASSALADHPTAQSHELSIDNIWFAPGSARLAKTNDQLLAMMAKELRAHPEITRVAVQGYAALRGDGPDKLTRWNLSLQRGREVVEALAALGVDRNRLLLVAYGSESQGNVAINRELDRRVTLKITQVETPALAAVVDDPGRNAQQLQAADSARTRIAASLGIALDLLEPAVASGTKSVAATAKPLSIGAVPLTANSASSPPVASPIEHWRLIPDNTCRIDANYGKQIALGALQ
jgi:hypothetical protein